MKNFHKVRGKREFLFDDRELVMLGGGAVIICILIFVLGVMIGQSLQEQSVASPLRTTDYLIGGELEIAEKDLEGETLLAENQPLETSSNVTEEEKKPQRGYFKVLPDSETYVEVEATPVKEAVPEPEPANTSPQATTKKADPSQEVANAATPIPTAAKTTTDSQPQSVTVVVPALPNVPKDASEDIRIGRQPRSSAMSEPLPGETLYSVQVASSPNREDSERLIQKFGEYGYQAYVMTADLGDKGIWYRVRVGNLATHEEAEFLKNELLAKTPKLTNSPYVIKVSE